MNMNSIVFNGGEIPLSEVVLWKNPELRDASGNLIQIQLNNNSLNLRLTNIESDIKSILKILTDEPSKNTSFGVIPGSAAPSLDNLTPKSKPVKRSKKDWFVYESSKVSKPSNMFLIPPNVGKITILGLVPQFQIEGYKVISNTGEDLINYLPVEFNYQVDDVKLIGIFGYSVKDTSAGKSLYLIYKTENIKTGSVRTFEASPYSWNNLAR